MVPRAAVEVEDGGAQGDAEAGAGEAPGGLVAQVQVLGEDLDLVRSSDDLEVGDRAQVPGDDELGSGIDELAARAVLHADEAVGEDGEPGVLTNLDDGLGTCGCEGELGRSGGQGRGHDQPFTAAEAAPAIKRFWKMR